MKVIKHIPNSITMLNLFAGSIATLLSFQGNFRVAFFLILLAGLFDFLDGFAARLLKAYSPMGKELDSLADVISFGMAPGAIVYTMLNDSSLPPWLAFAGFLIPVFSALRLAKFNIDESQTSSFIGLPTPSNAIFWAGVGFSFAETLVEQPLILLLLTLIFSGLLVSPLPMFSLKFSGLKWSQSKMQYLFLGGCILLIVILGWDAFAPLILWYILSSAVIYPVFKRSA